MFESIFFKRVQNKGLCIHRKSPKIYFEAIKIIAHHTLLGPNHSGKKVWVFHSTSSTRNSRCAGATVGHLWHEQNEWLAKRSAPSIKQYLYSIAGSQDLFYKESDWQSNYNCIPNWTADAKEKTRYTRLHLDQLSCVKSRVCSTDSYRPFCLLLL